jgi:CheY-like chemotaxis protein
LSQSRLSLRSRTILVNEEDVDSLEAMRLLLESHGAQVMTATDGFDGPEQLERRTPDAILCDLTMP